MPRRRWTRLICSGDRDRGSEAERRFKDVLPHPTLTATFDGILPFIELYLIFLGRGFARGRRSWPARRPTQIGASMATCANCKTEETDRYEGGVPICLLCANAEQEATLMKCYGLPPPLGATVTLISRAVSYRCI